MRPEENEKTMELGRVGFTIKRNTGLTPSALAPLETFKGIFKHVLTDLGRKPQCSLLLSLVLSFVSSAVVP